MRCRFGSPSPPAKIIAQTLFDSTLFERSTCKAEFAIEGAVYVVEMLIIFPSGIGRIERPAILSVI